LASEGFIVDNTRPSHKRGVGREALNARISGPNEQTTEIGGIAKQLNPQLFVATQ